jgi:DNA polymerase III subunit beta
MNITVNRAELQRVLTVTQNIVEKRTTMPILANVLLKATSGHLHVSATDLEVTAITKTVAKVEEQGSLTVNAKVLHDIVRELVDEQVTLLCLEGDRLEITTGSSRLRINGVSAEEYPGLPGMSIGTQTYLPASEMLHMVNRTLYAVSLDETRFNLNGVCFEKIFEEGKDVLRLTATDGHRLAIVSRPIGQFNLTEPVIVPRKGLVEVKKLLDGQLDALVGMVISEGFFVVETTDTKVSMRLIDGEFPDYRQVVPRPSEIKAIVPVTPFVQALRRVSLLVTDKGKCVTMSFSQDLLKISSSSPELGEAVEQFPIEFQGDPLTTGFNARYLLDIANAAGTSETLVIELNGPLGAGKFYPQSDESAIAVVMPMRLA